MLDESYEIARREGDRIEIRTAASGSDDLEEFWVHLDRSGGASVLRGVGVEAAGRGSDVLEAYADLDTTLAESEGRRIACCGSCRHFQITGMSRQMSAGQKGYCLLNVRDHGRSREDLVSVFDRCDQFDAMELGAMPGSAAEQEWGA